jgi:hypothetical protein
MAAFNDVPAGTRHQMSFVAVSITANTLGQQMNATDCQDNEVRQRRRSLSRRVILPAALVLFVAWAGAGILGTQSAPSGHRVIYAETLPDGRVFQCFSDGAFIGSPGFRVESRRSPQAPEGSEGGPARVVRPPDYTEEEARRALEEYKKSGRSADRDQADFDRLSTECRSRR